MSALGPVKYLTIHASDTPEGRHVSYEQINAWDKAKFGQISYHWVIELDGSMRRTLRDDQLGAHVGKKNTGNIGICYIGGRDANMHAYKDTRTDVQRKSMLTLVRTYRGRYPILKEAGRIKGHRDWSPDLDRDGLIESHEWLKVCPCFDVAAWLKEMGE